MNGLFERRVAVALQAVVAIASLVALYFWLPDTLEAVDAEIDSDFPNFNGAALLWREGLGDHLYVMETEIFRDEEVRDYCGFGEPGGGGGGGGPHHACRALFGNFRSPPHILLVYLPLSALPGEAPYVASFLLVALGSVALAALGASCFTSPGARVAFFLAVLALPILHLAVRLSQPSMFYALAALAGFMLNREGKPLPAALCFAVLSFKPQFLILPFLALLYLRSWRTAAWTAGLSAVLVSAGFALVGPDVAINYVELNLDLLEEGAAPITTSWMYNWEGFLFALTGETQELLSRLLAAATLLVALSLVLGRRSLAPALAVAATALAAPYVLFYDWTLLVAAAALLAATPLESRQRLLSGFLMAGVWAAIWATHASLPIFGTQSDELADGSVYWSTLALAGAILVALVGLQGRQQTVSAGATGADEGPARSTDPDRGSSGSWP